MMKTQDVKMLADLRVLHQRVVGLYAGIKDVQARYTETDLLKYADMANLVYDTENLREILQWLLAMRNKLAERRKEKRN